MIGDQSNPNIVKRPSYTAIRYNSNNDSPKAIYTWDRQKNAWIKMPSSIDNTQKYIRAITHLPFSQLAILEDKEEVYEGTATWYDAREDYTAACNIFPMNSLVKVTALSSGKSIIVRVADTGAFASHIIIDLDDNAFKDLASLGTGVMKVRIELADQTEQSPQDEDELTITSPSAMVINAGTGEVLWGKNNDQIRSIASLTKIMTAAVFLDSNTPMDKIVTYQAEDEAIGGRLKIKPGERLTTKDLLYSMLTGSANNAANALARSTGLSRTEFVNRMNAKAQEWGLKNTSFADPSGLDPNNKSTAADYAVMARRALNSMTMLQVTTTRNYYFKTLEGVPHNIKNTNKLIDTDLYITGGKTGYLDEALYCHMTKAKDKNGNQVIAVVLGSLNSSTRFNETERLIRWGFRQLTH
jgi:D-alanyl-D-alanine carboxypeptidase